MRRGGLRPELGRYCLLGRARLVVCSAVGAPLALRHSLRVSPPRMPPRTVSAIARLTSLIGARGRPASASRLTSAQVSPRPQRTAHARPPHCTSHTGNTVKHTRAGASWSAAPHDRRPRRPKAMQAHSAHRRATRYAAVLQRASGASAPSRSLTILDVPRQPRPLHAHAVSAHPRSCPTPSPGPSRLSPTRSPHARRSTFSPALAPWLPASDREPPLPPLFLPSSSVPSQPPS